MGLLGNIFGKSSGQTTSKPSLSDAQALEIIQRYGKVVENEAPAPGCVADAGKLPYPKAQIKEALIIGLRFAKDPKMADALMASYLQLSDWQEGVGQANQGFDVEELLAANHDVKTLIEKVAEQSQLNDKWTTAVASEQEALKQDLVRLGFWRD
jgi:hypothetical protein